MNIKFPAKFFRTGTLALMCLLSQSCGYTKIQHPSPNDPWEAQNRATFNYNEANDKYFFKPIAKFYVNALPNFLTRGISNMYHNLGEVTRVANDLLQADIPYAASDTMRFVVNTTVGVGGFFEVAEHTGLQRHTQDFGLTLAKWGYTNSTYLVLPLFGPSTVRDAIAIPVNLFMGVYPYIHDVPFAYSLAGGEFISLRADMLSVEDIRKQAAIDPYVFTRDAYMQYRNNLINKNESSAKAAGKNEDIDEVLFGSDSQKPANTTSSDKLSQKQIDDVSFGEESKKNRSQTSKDVKLK